jgi:hypothetical protein
MLATPAEMCSFDYAIIRVVPRVEREEFINVGAIVFCAAQRFLEARIELDIARLQVLAPGSDAAMIEAHLHTIPLICGGGRAAGPIGALGQTARFHWLVAPRSTIIQTSAVHSGLCHDPSHALEHLMQTRVRV